MVTRTKMNALARTYKTWRAFNCLKSMANAALIGVGGFLCFHGTAHAEGSFQIGLEQTMVDIPAGTTQRYIRVDILNPNEVINLNACGTADTQEIQFTIFDNNLLQVNQGSVATANVSCSSNMTTPLLNSYQYTASPGTYYVSIDNLEGSTLQRYDITVTSNAGINPDPTATTGISGRVSAEAWQFNTGSYAENTSTDADYFILTPGGFANTNYVWELDLNNFAGFAYDLKANNRGVDAPNSGFSTPTSGNSVTQQYPLYINYPAIADPEPVRSPLITGFRFVDEDGNDNSISPGGTVGVQDSGFFEFTTDTDTGTYAIYIDVDQNGVFGNAGDVQLNGDALNGFNSIPFDGRDNNGDPLPIGTYNAQLGVRLGEFHFIANDAETSGGGAAATGNGDGLTVWQASPGGQAVTSVYWDDVTVLGAGAGGTSNVPFGADSGTTAGTHTWGNFTSGGFGNARFIDTYVFGNTTFATQDLIVADDDYTDAVVDITDTSIPGDVLTVSVTDGDQNDDPAALDTISVVVVNDVTGESETITLTETGVDTGIFTNTLPTTFGTSAGTNDDGTMNSQNGDTITVTYNDPSDADGNPEVLTDTDTVNGGASGVVTITPTSVPGDTLDITVTDADIAGDGTLVVAVTNPNTGETENVTLTENVGTPGLFEGTIDTEFGIIAGANNDGTMNTQNGDTVVVTYNDALSANGGPAMPTATDNVSGGTTATVTITPTSVPGDTLTVTVSDADQTGAGTLVVNLENPATGETETLTLIESGSTPGQFEATIDTIFGTTAGTNDDGTFNTQDGQTVVVTYTDVLTASGNPADLTATDTVSGGVTGVVSIDPTSMPGDTVALSVNDADLAGDGTLVVSVVNSVTGEIETVTLTENVGTPGLFEGTVDTIFGTTGGANNDGTFNTQNGDSLVVTYNDALTDNGGTASPTATDNVTAGVDGTVTITPTSNPGDTLAISVNDADLTGNGTLNVSVVNDVTGEIETITLTESGVTPGLFEGTVATTFGATAGTNNDGTFNTQDGDSVTVTYTDALTFAGGTAAPTATDAVNGGVTGTVTITPTSTPGDTLDVTVTDADLIGTGPIVVTAVNPTTGESEQITLTESGVTPGLFEGMIATAFGTTAGTDNDGTFNTQATDTIVVTYNDALTDTGATAMPTATDTVSGGNDGVVSIDPTSTPGDTVALSVSDDDLIGSGTLVVTVVNPDTGESEQITLTESGVTPGLFEGTVDTVFGATAGTDNDGTFNTQNGQTLVVTYNDALTANGGTASPTATDTVSGGNDAVLTITPESLPGDTLTVSLTDLDLNTNTGTVETVTISVTNTNTGEVESLTLTETGQNTGIFTATIDTELGTMAGAVGDNSLTSGPGDLITATYNDALNGAGSTQTLNANDNVLGLSVVKTGMFNDGGDGIANVGDTITYTFSVTNRSNVTLSNVVITDATAMMSGGPIPALAAGANDMTTFTASYALTQADIDAGGVTNTAIGTAQSPNGVTVTSQSDDPTNPANDDPDGDGIPSDPTITTLGATPSIAVLKTGTPDLGADGILNAGDVINYTFEVTNTGNVTLSAITIADVNVTVNGGPLASLAVGASDATTFSAAYTILQADMDAGSVTNTATVTGMTPGGGSVTGVSDDPANTNDVDPDGDGNPSDPTITDLPSNGSMELIKTSTIDDGGDGFADPGDTITYNFTVRNVGNVTLENITITDALVTVNGGPIASLAPGSSDAVTFSATYTLVEADLVNGQVTNSASATGREPDGSPVTAISDDPANPTNDDPDGDGNPSDPTVTTLDVNFPPTAEDDSTSTQMGTAVAIPVIGNDNDPENLGLTITGVTQPPNGTVSFDPDGTVIYTPDTNFMGTDTFTYTVCDSRNQCVIANVTVTVDDNTPSAVTDAAGTQPDQPVIIEVLLNDTDPDNDPLQVSNPTDPANGSVVVNADNTVTYTPDPGFTGVDTFTYTACDPLGFCDTAIVSVTVSADTPQAMDDTSSTPSETPVTINTAINDTDPNGDPLTVTAVTQPANGSAVVNPDGTVTYTPDPQYIGPDIFTYTICDDSNNCDTATVTLTVTNQPPVAENDTVSTGENTPVSIPVLDNDSDIEGPVTLTAFTPPTNGTVVINPDNTVTYTPTDSFTGTDTFTYTICDNSNVCVDGTVNVTITPEVPILDNDAGETEPGDPVIIAVLDNDSDPNGDTLTVTDVTQPADGTVVINADGTVTVTPDEDFEGVLTITYTACDTNNNCSTAEIFVTVEAVTPVAENDMTTTPSATPVTYDVLVNDTDPNGDPLTVTMVSLPEGGTAAINSDGEVVVTPDADFVGDLVVTYTVCDTDGNCDTATLTVTVEPPVANINGVVFLDINGDDTHQPNEPLESAWIVEVLNPAGEIIATTTTDANGFYELLNIPVGDTMVAFRNPDTSVEYGRLEGIVLNAGTTTIDQNLPIDPSGVVYDSNTRAPIANVAMTFLGEDGTPLPGVCFVDPLQQGQMTDPDGMYRFDIIPGADPACPVTETNYRIAFDAPPTHNDAASVIIPGMGMPLNPPAGVGPFAIAPQAMAPMGGDSTDYYLEFILAQGDRDVINNHIPLDNNAITRAPLQVTKSTPRTTISFADIVPYTITVTNTENVQRFNLDFVDRVPPGFKYVSGSARLNGAIDTPIVIGRDVIFSDRMLAPNEVITIELTLVAGASVREGRYINQGLVRNSLDQGVLSNIAEATVQLVPSPLFDCSEVIGKVFDDKNKNGYQDKGEPGLPGVRLVSAKGLTITTDEHGRYHIACAAVPNSQIGSNYILKLEERSLPTGYRLTTENPRVVRLTRGKMTKLNFGSSIQRVVTLDLSSEAFSGRGLRMTASMEPHIMELVRVLRSQESILRINYHDYENSGPMGQARLNHVAQHIEHLWETQGCCYRLIIERKLLTGNVVPTVSQLREASR